MEERFKKLDNFLRRHLDDASEDPTWNVPDDAVYEQAMRTVQEQKKKKRRAWLLIPILLGAFLLANEYYHHRQIETLQGKITSLEENLARESAATNSIASSAARLQDIPSAAQATTQIENQGNNATATVSETSPKEGTTQRSNPRATLPSNYASSPSASNTRSLDTRYTPSQLIKSETKEDNKILSESGSVSMQANSGELNTDAGSETIVIVDFSKTRLTSPILSGQSETGEIKDEVLADMLLVDNWITMPTSSLELKGIETKTTLPVISPIVTLADGSLHKTTVPVYAMEYGLLLGGNQSRLNMSRIPPGGDVQLYDYDNTQPGFSMSGFVNKSLSRRWSIQTGIGYHVYKNKSIMEDQFLLDTNSISLMPNGESMYQADYDLINPIGQYNMLLGFRVSDQMQHNDTIVEYAENEQTMHNIMLDMGVHYNLLALPHVKVSLGTGFGLGYMAGLQNEFAVSTFYNGILQERQMETPDHLKGIKRWYGQWIGNLSVSYYPKERFGIILNAQYNAGVTSIRDGGSAKGPLTFLHSWALSAGISNRF